MRTNDRLWQTVVNPDMHERLTREWKKRKCLTKSDLVRQLLAEALGDESLGESKRGRPAKEPAAE